MSDSENEFYIGWRNKMPGHQASFVKRIVIAIFVIIPIITLLAVYFQKPFNDFIFEFGNVKEFTGIYRSSPVPILEITDGSLPPGVSNFALLVNSGKFGAEGTIQKIEASSGSLDNRFITIRGTLISGDGKAVIELTEKENSLVEVSNENRQPLAITDPSETVLYTGEILDPKCYFGVMKPGEGKIHKSCAIRCISGGIPPVFRTGTSDSGYSYSILLGSNGQKINKEILEFVGEQIQLKARKIQQGDWTVLYADADQIKRAQL